MADNGKKLKKAPTDGAEDAAERFKSLGDATRLRIIQFLRCRMQEATENAESAHPGGAFVTDISRAVIGTDKLTSTFSHHLKELRHAGLISVEKDGKNRWYQVVPGALDALSGFLVGPSTVDTVAVEAETLEPEK